eukprot:CAMPEP_0180064714 /NCGR_PEP_ID=MMETSP0985-20121206/8327_1 /TAXON_ID=483367 /ORGANISM="non described non described, Strain CCMP 2436" /LENGTH=201 /DNA_ID=CAMNT_0021995031 /DNA_START=38 /DNA_END=644 /DNA_ORIENTATION=-
MPSGGLQQLVTELRGIDTLALVGGRGVEEGGELPCALRAKRLAQLGLGHARQPAQGARAAHQLVHVVRVDAGHAAQHVLRHQREAGRAVGRRELCLLPRGHGGGELGLVALGLEPEKVRHRRLCAVRPDEAQLGEVEEQQAQLRLERAGCDVALQLGRVHQAEGAVRVELDQEHRLRVVTTHRLDLVVQPARLEALGQVGE